MRQQLFQLHRLSRCPRAKENALKPLAENLQNTKYIQILNFGYAYTASPSNAYSERTASGTPFVRPSRARLRISVRRKPSPAEMQLPLQMRSLPAQVVETRGFTEIMASLSTACSTFACWSTWQHHQSKVSKVLNVWCDQTWPMTASNLFLIDLKSSCSMAKALMILSLALTTRPSSSLRPCRITCCWCICGRKKLWTDLPPQRKFTPFRGSKIKVRVIIKQARGDKLVKRPKTCWAQYEETVHCSNEREKTENQ